MPIVNTCSLCSWVRLLSGHAPSLPDLSQHAPPFVQPLIASLNQAGTITSAARARPLTSPQVFSAEACISSVHYSASAPDVGDTWRLLLGVLQPTILFLINKTLAEALNSDPRQLRNSRLIHSVQLGQQNKPFLFTLPHTPNDNGASTTGIRSACDHTHQHAPRLPSPVPQFHYRPQWQPRIHLGAVIDRCPCVLATPYIWISMSLRLRSNAFCLLMTSWLHSKLNGVQLLRRFGSLGEILIISWEQHIQGSLF